MSTYSKAIYNGRFIPKNISKYRGDITKIVYRSSYELKFMNWCDKNDSVLEWGSEEIIVPYRSPLDNKVHRYFVDFYAKIHTKKGIQKFLIEVKPSRFTQEPKIPLRKTKRFIAEVKQWGVNLAKWESATEFCLDRGWQFLIITEKELGITV